MSSRGGHPDSSSSNSSRRSWSIAAVAGAVTVAVGYYAIFRRTKSHYSMTRVFRQPRPNVYSFLLELRSYYSVNRTGYRPVELSRSDSGVMEYVLYDKPFARFPRIEVQTPCRRLFRHDELVTDEFKTAGVVFDVRYTLSDAPDRPDSTQVDLTVHLEGPNAMFRLLHMGSQHELGKKMHRMVELMSKA